MILFLIDVCGGFLKIFFLFITVFITFVSCKENTPKSNEICKGVICEEWKQCNIENGMCDLQSERCSNSVDCKNNKICSLNHYCITEIIDKCKDIICNEPQYCNTENGMCELINGRCLNVSDCNENQLCDLNYNCITKVCNENETKQLSCGFNNNGNQTQICVNNSFVNEGICQNIDVCTNETTQFGLTPCGYNEEGFYGQKCINGQWIEDTSICSGTDECENNTNQTGTTSCGFNNKGFYEQSCKQGKWIETPNCLDNDICLNNSTQIGTTSCNINQTRGAVEQLCINGQWIDNSICSSFFITTWKTDNFGITTNNQILIPINPEFTYNYNVDCNNDGIWEAKNITTSYICNYQHEGVYTVSISGTFPAIMFDNDTESTDSAKLISVKQWGNIQWQSMHKAFYDCVNLTVEAFDNPDLSNVIDMSYMFYNVKAINQTLNSWNVSNITNMSGLFKNAITFNQPLNNWDVSNVTGMGGMFMNAQAFNNDITSWDTGNVVYMNLMFYNADSFNQNINSWNTENVVYMGYMFYNAKSFNQNLSLWNVNNATVCNFFGKNAFLWILSKPNFTNCNPE